MRKSSMRPWLSLCSETGVHTGAGGGNCGARITLRSTDPPVASRAATAARRTIARKARMMTP
jgi:hypothetical protein